MVGGGVKATGGQAAARNAPERTSTPPHIRPPCFAALNIWQRNVICRHCLRSAVAALLQTRLTHCHSQVSTTQTVA